ncbi:hypothetical protein [Azospirillum griseum]|uniref:Uncharacterized protein n=1 Tax=Azospirillum griseum TaxID=2496639 RepID=A0A3S0K6X5_9PROT|nr:hypothetical protein [Azospirillum griseum]RTR23046.1 hypothetical protein EJ903_05635 [Azospirillum griseum]
MSRVASESIKGYLYQFNKCLVEILKSTPPEEIAIEGIIEDVEVISPSLSSYIQCKYHESKDKFVLSDIYKPVLQMLEQHEKFRAIHGTVANVRYILFCHIPGGNTSRTLTSAELDEILLTGNGKLKDLAEKLATSCDRSGFLKLFWLEFGPSYDELSDEADRLLVSSGLNDKDVGGIFYPNAIHKIAEAATQADKVNRVFTKDGFIRDLKNLKKVTLSRWTKELKSKEKILQAVRKQLLTNLDRESRDRYFVFSEEAVNQFDDDIVVFIKDFIDRYQTKPYDKKPPLFCFECPDDKIEEIKERLHKKSVRFEDGMINKTLFDAGELFKTPMVQVSGGNVSRREFQVRIMHHLNMASMTQHRPDDLFLVCDPKVDDALRKDTNSEALTIDDAAELKYIFGLRGNHE